jgi:ferric-dicitrate binding protein FerR (iron transport regulator)
MPTMFEQAIAHIKAGEIENARPLLIEVLKQNPADENAWLWMTKCVTETEQKRYCFERVLKINPQNQYAIRELRHLTRPVSPPTQPKTSQPEPVQPVQPVPKRGLGDVILTFATFAISVFLILLCLYAWWLSR